MKRLGGLILLALLGQTAWANVVSLTPPAVTAGGPAFTLIMNSQGADMYDIVTWNGQQLPSCVQAPIAPCFNFVNASRVDVLVPASFISLPGFVQVGFVGFNFQNLIVNQRPQIATAALPPGTTGQSYTQMVVVTGGTPPLTTSVVPGTQLPPGLTLNPNGVINGTPTLAGTYPVVVQVADIFQVTTSRTLPILITQGTVVLRPAVVGAPYSVQIPGLSATGAPASCALVSGALPAGLSLNANCTITGTPTATGQATVIVQRVFNPNLQDTVPVSLQVVAALALSPTTLPNGSVGTSYSQPVTGSGGIPPYTLRLSSGSLPTGVSLQTTQTPTTTAYSLTGNPTAAGTFNFTLQLTDSAGNASSTAYTITIGGRLAITTTSLPNGTVGVGYSQTVAATGGTPPYTFDVPPGSLPGGLSLSTAGVLSGTPATAGIAPLTVNVTDSARVAARQSLPLLIQLPAGTAGVAYSARLTIAGGAGPFTCALVSGALPAGLALTANGCLIDQTPTTAGSFPFMLRISDPGGSPQTMQQSITILPALTLAPATLPSGTFGAAYSASLTATGGVGPYTFTTVQGTSLPGGLSLAANGQISGTPNAAGTFTFMAQVADSGVLFPARVTRAYTITIAPPPVTQLTITTPAQVMPAQQSNVSVQLAPAYPLPLTGTLTLTFNPDAVVPVDDPNVVFSNASRTVAFTIPANATQGVFTSPVMVQTGTVAGDIRLTARLMQGATDVTPSPAPVQTIRLNRTAPGITSVRVVRTAPGFDVIVIGHSTPRDMSQAGFAFTGTSSLQTTAVTVPATQLFTTWYQSANSGRFGSEFQFTQSFTVQGDISAIRSVAVTLTNSTAASPPMSANFP